MPVVSAIGMGRSFAKALAVILCLPLPGCRAEPKPWGEVVNGLRMSVRLTAENSPDAQFVITVENVGDKPALLPLGNIIGYEAYPSRLRVVVITPDGRDHRVICIAGPAAIGGRIDLLVIPMLPQSTYTVRTDLSQYYILKSSEKLATFILRLCTLRIELDTANLRCPLYGPPNPNMVACWQGKVVSNVLVLPR